jgi:hypothetical protein
MLELSVFSQEKRIKKPGGLSGANIILF